MRDLLEQTDEQLIRRLQEQTDQVYDEENQWIVEHLLDKYKYLVRKKANAMFLMGGDKEDLIQEGMIGLFKAIRDYDPNEKASFSYFAEICVSRQIYTAVEASQRMKHAPLNTYVSFWNEEAKSEGGNLLDTIQDGEMVNPENLVIAREDYAQFLETLRKKLSKLENQVLNLYLQGMTYQQIAKELERPVKTIDNALQRIKGKMQ